MRPSRLLPTSLVALIVATGCTDSVLTAPEPPASQPRFVLNAVGDPVTFCNPAVITIRDNATAVPYPSSITVAGLAPGTYAVTATIKNFTHPVPADVDMVLVGPGGQKVMLMSDANGILNQFHNLTLTFDDDAAAFVPAGFPSLSSGTYKPSNYGTTADVPPGGSPAGPYSSELAVFGGTPLNGTWALYVWDDAFINNKPINGGWCVNFTPLDPDPTAHAGGPYHVTAGVALTLNGTGSSDPDNDIASYDWDFGDGTTGSGPTPSHTYATGGTYTVTLTVTDAGGFTATATSIATVFPVGTYCNPARINIVDDNPASLYPSTITVVNGLTGSFKITVAVNGIFHPHATDLDMLLVGPGGQNVMLMSDVAGAADLQNATLTFDDAASGQIPNIPGGLVLTGTYRPTNHNVPDALPAPAPAAPHGSALAVFSGTNSNGAWRLFIRDHFNVVGGNGAVIGGWCLTMTETNSAPVANAGGPYTGVEGSPITFNGTASTDADNNIDTYAWDFGDGTPGSGATVQHTYANGGTYTVTLTVTDVDGASSSASTTVMVSHVAPTATFNAPTTVTEGSSVTVSLTSPSLPDARYAFDCGSGYGPIGSSASAACPTTDDGSLPVRAKVVDASIDQLFTEYGAIVTVTNAAPTAVFANSGSTTEGLSFVLSLSNASDAPEDLAAGFGFAFDCGAGAGYAQASDAPSAACPTSDNGEISVKAKVMDKDGGVSEYTATVTVTNVAPRVTSISLPLDPVAIGTPVQLGASFFDVGLADTHTGSFELGVGGPDVAGAVTSGSLSATVTFAHAGVYTIVARVTDDDGGVGSLSSASTVPAFVVVYDPSGSFVTGGGWISSPAGAYAAEPSFAGKASFGFVAKYKPGASLPSGNTEFQFKAGNLNFKSTSYEWLVVSAAHAKYKGEGTINGGGSYGFMITAVDGDSPGSGEADGFRIKIWEVSSGAVVYDNKMGEDDGSHAATLLGGGSIVIHK